MIIAEIGTRPNGQDYATHGSTSARSLSGLARALVSTGTPDQPWEARRGGRVAMRGPSLHRLASMIVSDSERWLGWVPYEPHPNAEVSPALAGVLDAAKAARAVHREALISARTAKAGASEP